MDAFYQEIANLCPPERDLAEFAAEILAGGPGATPSTSRMRTELDQDRPPTAVRILQVSRFLGAPPPWVFGSRIPSEETSCRWLINAIISSERMTGHAPVATTLQQVLAENGIRISRTGIGLWVGGHCAAPDAALRVLHDFLNPGGANLAIPAPEWAPQERRTRYSGLMTARRAASKAAQDAERAERSKATRARQNLPPRINERDLSTPMLRAELAALGDGDPRSLPAILGKLSKGPGKPPLKKELSLELAGKAPIGQARVLQLMRAHGGIPRGIFDGQGGLLPHASGAICHAIAGQMAIGPDIDHRVWLHKSLDDGGAGMQAAVAHKMIDKGVKPRENRRRALMGLFPEVFGEAILQWERMPDGTREVARRRGSRRRKESAPLARRLTEAMKMDAPDSSDLAGALHERLSRFCPRPPSLRVIAGWCSGEIRPNRQEFELIALALRCQVGFLAGNRPYKSETPTRSELRDMGAAMSDRVQMAERFFRHLHLHIGDIRQIPADPLTRIRLAVSCRGQLPDPSPDRDLFSVMRYMIGLRVGENDPWLAGRAPPPQFVLSEIADMCSVELCWMEGEALSEFSMVLDGVIPDILGEPMTTTADDGSA